jgi:hypothetical protein
MEVMRTSAVELDIVLVVVVLGGLSLFGCGKSGGGAASTAAAPAVPTAVAPSAPPSAEFDQKWAALASKEVDAFYLEDDRGEGLMGNVRRARHEQPLAEKNEPEAAHENLSQEEIQQVIRQNLPGVKACFLRVSREGEQRSGKAIVSFDVGPGGDVRGTKVDAPSFQGTSLSNCVSGMVSHWAFPKSQSGGPAVSYPFVFVGG